MRNRTWNRAGTSGRIRTTGISLALGGALVLAGCDLGVSNPALIDEEDLRIPQAVPAIVNGARHSFGLGTTIFGAGGVYSVSAILTDELTHVGSWVPPREISDGEPGNESPENQSHWGHMSRARWQAEDAIEKVSDLVPSPQSNQWVALATLYAGFSNRVLGDMFCQAVIDGSGLLPNSAFHERAEGHFGNAITIAGAAGRTDIENAAYAGRAQVRMMLGNWGEALADAAQVPTDFVYAHPHSDNSSSENNGVFNWAAVSSGQYSVWGTPFAEWGEDVTGTLETEGDPRASFLWQDFIGGDARRQFWFTEKYTSRSDAIPLAKGTEMRLIEAEVALRNNDLTGALDKINEVRTHHGLDDATAADLDEGWQLLMKERGLELWLEGRRLGDMRRWADDGNTAGYLAGTDFTWSVRGIAVGESPENDPRVAVPDANPFCLRISTNEIFSNPNIDPNDAI